jgi:hypothetical protein
MQVLILGAGASKPAGYPLASEVMDAIKKMAEDSASVELRQAWEEWDRFRQSLPPDFKLIAYNMNPEVVLSLPDLFLLAIEHEDADRQTAAYRLFSETGEAHLDELEKYFNSDERAALQRAAKARSRFLRCLDYFFARGHHYDRDQRQRRAYLKGVLDSLQNGDVVITLNWDTTVERTLAEAGRWSPLRGYGFDRDLALVSQTGDPSPLPEGFPVDSPILVLKLHGSFGWRTLDGDVYFESTRYLHEFGFQYSGIDFRFVDPREPHVYTLGTPLIAYPSFLKRVEHDVMNSVWRKASDRLAAASSIHVWGYSLPGSDGALRALLHPLARRVERREVHVTVHDPAAQTLDRWRRLLGKGIEFRKERLHECGISEAEG